MRALLTALLLPALLASSADTDDRSVRDEASNFEIAVPPEKAGDWDEVALDEKRKDVKAHFKTEFRDTEPLATAEVQVIVRPLNKELAARGLDNIAAMWSSHSPFWRTTTGASSVRCGSAVRAASSTFGGCVARMQRS